MHPICFACSGVCNCLCYHKSIVSSYLTVSPLPFLQGRFAFCCTFSVACFVTNKRPAINRHCVSSKFGLSSHTFQKNIHAKDTEASSKQTIWCKCQAEYLALVLFTRIQLSVLYIPFQKHFQTNMQIG